MTNKRKLVWEYLKRYGSITNLEMMRKFFIVAPHSVIRDLRRMYGLDIIKDVWITNKRTEYDTEGKEHQITVRYKKYFIEAESYAG